MRRASETSFPYGWPNRIVYFVVDGRPVQINGRDAFRAMVADAVAGNTTLFAAWPGEYRTDLFVIDNPKLLAEAIGLVLA